MQIPYIYHVVPYHRERFFVKGSFPSGIRRSKPVSSFAFCKESTSSAIVAPSEFSPCVPSNDKEPGLPDLGACVWLLMKRTMQAAAMEREIPKTRGRVSIFFFLASCILLLFFYLSILSFSVHSFSSFASSPFFTLSLAKPGSSFSW